MGAGARVKVKRVGHAVLRALRVLVWVALASLQGVALIGVALYLWARSPAGHERLRALVETRVQPLIPGLRLGSLGGDLPRVIVLGDVLVNDASGRPAVRIAEVRARVDLWALASRRIRLDQLTVAAPQVLARRLDDGRLNLAGLVTPGPAGATTAVWPIEIRAFTIDRGAVGYMDVEHPVTVSGLTAHGAVTIRAGEVAAAVGLGALASGAGRTVALELAASGTLVRDVIALRVDRLAVAGLTAGGTVTLHGAVRGSLAELRVVVTGTLPDGAQAQVAGAVGLGGAFTYDLTADVGGLDPRALVATWPAGRLSLTAHAGGRGLPATPGATARVTLELRPSRLAAIAHLTGRLTADLDGRAWRVPALTAEVPGLTVRANGHGTAERLVLDLTADLDRSSAVAYLPRTLHGRARLRAHAVVSRPERLELLRAHLRATSCGFAGTSVGALDLDVEAAGPVRLPRGEARIRARRVRVTPNAPLLDRLALVASNRHGRLRVSGRAAGARVSGTIEARGAVTARGARVTVERFRGRYGAYSVALQQPAELRWQRDRQVSVAGLRVATLGGEISARGTFREHARAQPWLEAHVVTRHLHVEHVPLPLDADLELSLTRDRLAAAGTLGLGGPRPATLTASLPIQRGRGVYLPRLVAHGAVEVHLEALGLPLKALPERWRAPARLTAGSVDLRADVTGDVGSPEGRLRVQLQRATVAGFTGLDAATLLTVAGRDAEVATSVSVHGARLLEAHGHTTLARPAWHGLARLPLTIDVLFPRFDLARLRVANPQLVALAGVLTGAAKITGTVAQPRIQGDLAVADAAVSGVPFARLSARADFRGAALEVEVAATQRAGGTLLARLTRTPAAAARATLTARYFDLAVLQPLLPHVDQVGGFLQAQLTLRGTVARPRMSGTVEVRLGSVTFTDAPPFRDVELRAHLANDRIELDSLTSNVGDGSVQLQGHAGLRGWLPSSWQARLQVHQVPVPDDSLSGATLDATVLATGELEGQQLIATLRVTHGLLTMPPLDTGRQRWSTAPLKGVYFVGEPPPKAAAAVAPRARSLAVRVTLDVDSFQVRGEEIDANFGARLMLYTEQDRTLIGGRIDARNGTLELFGNRYQLAKTHIQWNASPHPNPVLDMRLTHRFPDAVVVIKVRGTAAKPDVSFASRPATYSRAEILSLIVTGQAADTGDASGNATANAVSAIATGFIRNITGRFPVLPIDVVRFQQVSQGQMQEARQTQMGSLTPTGQVTQIEVGKRITNRLQISYVHVFGANQDENANEVHVQFRLSPRWVLQSEYGDAGVGGLDVLWRKRY